MKFGFGGVVDRFRSYEPHRTGAPPVNVGGITFECWHVGISRYKWIDKSGDLSAWSNTQRATYSAHVRGVGIIGNRYRTLKAAMTAHVSFAKKPWFPVAGSPEINPELSRGDAAK